MAPDSTTTTAAAQVDAARRLLGRPSTKGWRRFDVADQWNSGHRLAGVWCPARSGADLVVFEADGAPLDAPLVVLGPPPIEPCLGSYRDATSLRPLPAAAASFGFVHRPDGIVITLFTYTSAAASSASAPLLTAIGPFLDGPSIADGVRARVRSAASLDDLRATLLARSYRAITLDLCGGASRPDQPPTPAALVPLWYQTARLGVVPVTEAPLAPFDIDAVRACVRRIVRPDDGGAGAAACLVLTDAGGQLVDRVVYECVPEVVLAERWAYFDGALEQRVRQLFALAPSITNEQIRVRLGLSAARAQRLARPIEAFARVLRRPRTPPPLPIAAATTPKGPLVIICCGFPGSGKSYLAERLEARSQRQWVRVNQDTLGSRPRCIEAMRKALSSGRSAVIDRTNITMQQREYFIAVAREHEARPVIAVMFDTPPNECAQRIMERADHPTLGPSRESIGIMFRFVKDLERPCIEEGLDAVFNVSHPDQIEPLLQRFA